MDLRVKRSRFVEWKIIEDKTFLVNGDDGFVLKLDNAGTAVWLARQDSLIHSAGRRNFSSDGCRWSSSQRATFT
jgi:hypothetical protein